MQNFKDKSKLSMNSIEQHKLDIIDLTSAAWSAKEKQFVASVSANSAAFENSNLEFITSHFQSNDSKSINLSMLNTFIEHQMFASQNTFFDIPNVLLTHLVQKISTKSNTLYANHVM